MKPMNNRGSLPYAAVAMITILLVSGWSAAVFSAHGSEDAADDITESQNAIEKTKDSVS